MKGNAVDGTKVAFDSGKLLFVDEVVELGVELSDLGGGGGHVHGLLASPQHHLSCIQPQTMSQTACLPHSTAAHLQQKNKLTRKKFIFCLLCILKQHTKIEVLEVTFFPAVNKSLHLQGVRD